MDFFLITGKNNHFKNIFNDKMLLKKLRNIKLFISIPTSKWIKVLQRILSFITGIIFHMIDCIDSEQTFTINVFNVINLITKLLLSVTEKINFHSNSMYGWTMKKTKGIFAHPNGKETHA